jgi:hypothetical protein
MKLPALGHDRHSWVGQVSGGGYHQLEVRPNQAMISQEASAEAVLDSLPSIMGRVWAAIDPSNSLEPLLEGQEDFLIMCEAKGRNPEDIRFIIKWLILADEKLDAEVVAGVISHLQGQECEVLSANKFCFERMQTIVSAFGNDSMSGNALYSLLKPVGRLVSALESLNTCSSLDRPIFQRIVPDQARLCIEEIKGRLSEFDTTSWDALARNMDKPQYLNDMQTVRLVAAYVGVVESSLNTQRIR